MANTKLNDPIVEIISAGPEPSSIICWDEVITFDSHGSVWFSDGALMLKSDFCTVVPGAIFRPAKPESNEVAKSLEIGIKGEALNSEMVALFGLGSLGRVEYFQSHDKQHLTGLNIHYSDLLDMDRVVPAMVPGQPNSDPVYLYWDVSEYSDEEEHKEAYTFLGLLKPMACKDYREERYLNLVSLAKAHWENFESKQ